MNTAEHSLAGWASLVYAAGLITLRSFVQTEPPLPIYNTKNSI